VFIPIKTGQKKRRSGLLAGHTCVQYVKRTESVILSRTPGKDGNARFTTEPMKPKSDQNCGRYLRFF